MIDAPPPHSLQLSLLAAEATGPWQSPALSDQVSNDLWKLFNKPKPSVRETKARPQLGLAQNAAIHRTGEARALAKPFMDSKKDL